MTATRLDRLVTLLETGSTQLIRNTAAQQLADIQKAHPDELFNLLTRVVPFLRSKKWDTRIAAAKAMGGIVENAEIFEPNPHEVKPPDAEVVVKKEEHDAGPSPRSGSESEPLSPSSDQLQLATLDVATILKHGMKLAASAGKEYDYFINSMDPAQRLAHQKKNLKNRLGFGGEYTEEDLIDESDLKLNRTNTPGPDALKVDTAFDGKPGFSQASDTVATPYDQNAETPGGEPALSKRQINMLKRKNKKEMKSSANKVRVLDLSEKKPNLPSARPEPVAVKTETSYENGTNGDSNGSDYFSLDRKGGDDESKVVQEFKGAAPPIKSELQPDEEEQASEWPFERLSELLMVDMFDFNWEIRHGAAMGLRELMRVHGNAAGREYGKTRSVNDKLNQLWLNDLACRLCCVFMLDRFGDYISDTVVAPIRETAGQALGAVLRYLSQDSVRSVASILRRLIMQNEPGFEKSIWQACHGGMIGMRYLVAVRAEFILKEQKLMDSIMEVVVRGLSDDDDVRAVSAETLIPVAEQFVKHRPASLQGLIKIVWDCLSNLSDDLSASTGSVMDLLAKLCSFPEVLEAMQINAAEDPEQSFTALVPRLYPFLRHTITSVRAAALRALLTFINLGEADSCEWVDGKALRLMFQNLLVERNQTVLQLSLDVFTTLIEKLASESSEKLRQEFGPHVEPLLQLTLHPIGVSRKPNPMNPGLFIRPSGQVLASIDLPARSPPPASGEPPTKKRRRSTKQDRETFTAPSSAHNIDTPMIQGDIDLVGIDVIIRSKTFAAKAFGRVISLWPNDESRISTFGNTIIPQLSSPFASTKTCAAMMAEEFAKHRPDAVKSAFASQVSSILLSTVESEPPECYSDLVEYMRYAQQCCHSLIHTFHTAGHLNKDRLPQIGATVQGAESWNEFSFSVKQGEKVVNQDFERLKAALSPAQRITAAEALKNARTDAMTAIEEVKAVKLQRDVRVKASAAAAVVAFRQIPKKITGTSISLMDSIKTEENVELQRRAASSVVSLIEQLVASGRQRPFEKLVSNLVSFYCVDTSETPEFHPYDTMEVGVLSLKKDEDIPEHADPVEFERLAKASKIQRRGAKEALEQLCITFGSDLFSKVSVLYKIITDPLKETFEAELPKSLTAADNLLGQQAIDGLSTLRAVVGKLHPELLETFVLELLPHIIKAVKCKYAVFRYSAAKCLASICSIIPVQGFTALVKEVLPSVSNPHDIFQRQGVIECIYHLIQVMGDGILPYVIFLIVPVLGRMSDSDNDIRLIATTAFATLVKLVPLEAGIPDPPGLPEELLTGRDRERRFIAQMLDSKKVEPFQVPVAIKADLRTYQQEGVNWLYFLNRYHLHGVLCDDMGLGKTLQTLCIVASDHHLRAEEFAKTQNPDVRRLPSLIVCPPTLSGHWQQEIRTYAPFLSTAAYVGPPAQRDLVRNRLTSVDVVITSYEICRNDIDVLAPLSWNYCVLDEGHLIKNPNAKTTLAVKRLHSNHRLILSGTPIQNNVLELWSLFDFLMPGFLGTEKVFKDRFAKPIAASRFSKSSSKEQEAGALAIEALHKQVLPFLLRRLKEEVLDDLPPKILQNYYCDLSELQRKLFEDFNKRQGKNLQKLAEAGDKESKQHIFQALQYMRKLCNAPSLVVKESHSEYATIQNSLKKQGSTITDPLHAPKLAALRDLLIDCGIGQNGPPANDATGTGSGSAADEIQTTTEAVSQHRVLIFCQMKEMLDIVQRDVLQKMLPSATFLRLDGSVEANRRQDLVNQFNSDPSIDILLLTTSVGGLGLNLTGADTVIFVEHDWNPQKDIQAMDRAHRIGQKKTVNVYRLITRGTLEEKILNLQRFKIDVASTVVNQQNAQGLAGMESGEILDLFNLGETVDIETDNKTNGEEGAGAVDEVTGEVKEKGKKGFLDELGELWDEKQYEEEFNLDGFLAKIKD